MGVILFFPFVGLFSRMLVKLYPDFKPVLTVNIDKTPTEVLDAATDALRKEIGHLLQECQLYNLRLLKIDAKLVFDDDTPFEINLNTQYKLFRKRLLELYHIMSRIIQMLDQEEQYRDLLTAFSQVEEADNSFIQNVSKAVSRQNIQEIDIASLLLVNRLFTQSCRMQIYCLKDVLLSLDLINKFDRAMEGNTVMAAEKAKPQAVAGY